jgi:uncharacterized membrane protein
MGMSTVRERAVENIEAVFVFLVLGAGFLAMFAEIHAFWLIWVFGFAVFLPLIGILTGEDEDDEDDFEHESYKKLDSCDDETTDALSTLRDRYARGDLTDEQFERKLDALFETDSPENAAEWRTRERDRIDER